VAKKFQSESNIMPARASPSGFDVIYNFSISLTCSFALLFGQYRNVFTCRACSVIWHVKG